MNIKLASMVSAVLLSANPVLASPTSPDWLPLHPKEAVPKIISKTDIGGKNAFIKAKVDKAAAKDWCSNWRPDDKKCVANLRENEYGETYTASANCETGELTDPFGRKYIHDGIVRGDEFWDGRFKFKDAKTGEPIGTDSASGGITLDTQWVALCPYGLPYNILPMKPQIDINQQQVFSKVRVMDSARSEGIGHNGSGMRLDPDLGVIIYSEPKSKSIKENTVLFRGSIIYGGPVRGMAYTFKTGCDPAPYYVEGDMTFANSNKMTLTGPSPVREGCKVVGYTNKSPNAKLVFEFPLH